ncbi:MAG: hypothetical protein ACLSB9_10665 [Hydrogeniiclostridium mannosilyticum]
MYIISPCRCFPLTARGFRIEDYPNAYAMFENEVSLPLHTCLTDEQADYLLHTCLELLHE